MAWNAPYISNIAHNVYPTKQNKPRTLRRIRHDLKVVCIFYVFFFVTAEGVHILVHVACPSPFGSIYQAGLYKRPRERVECGISVFAGTKNRDKLCLFSVRKIEWRVIDGRVSVVSFQRVARELRCFIESACDCGNMCTCVHVYMCVCEHSH